MPASTAELLFRSDVGVLIFFPGYRFAHPGYITYVFSSAS
jgi:hypothetical protein